jgi:ABC-type multidrug transport system fused ATPase/permease subunit
MQSTESEKTSANGHTESSSVVEAVPIPAAPIPAAVSPMPVPAAVTNLAPAPAAPAPSIATPTETSQSSKKRRTKSADSAERTLNDEITADEISAEQKLVESVMRQTENKIQQEEASVWPPPLFVMRTASDAERYYMKYRWQNQWQYYDGKATENKRNYQWLQLTIGIGSVAVPVLLGFQGSFTIVATIVSLIVAASAAIENVKKFGDGWRSFRSAAEALQREKALYDVSAGPYRIAKRPFIRFVERCEDIIAQQNGQFMQREEQQPQNQQQAGEKDEK